jgi:hypothetical protein
MSDDAFRVDHAADACLGDEPPDLSPLRALAERAETGGCRVRADRRLRLPTRRQ